MPTLAREVPRLLPKALKQCYAVSRILEKTVKHLEDVLGDEAKGPQTFLFAPFEPVGLAVNKKRKTPTD